MKTKVNKDVRRRIKAHDGKSKIVTFPQKVTMVAENKNDEEILDFIVSMDREGGLTPSIDMLVDMITSGQLRRVGDRWQLQVGAVISQQNQDLVMFG